jgi:hypothetical protein
MARKHHRHQKHGGGSAWAENWPVTDEDAADELSNGHPKSEPPSLDDGNSFPSGTTGAGSAPGANGPPTTGAIGP